MTPAIEFENVSKRYNLGLTRSSLPSVLSQMGRRLMEKPPHISKENIFWALKDVSFVLDRGQSLGLVGANGAGKTTILKLLANITKPTFGQLNSHGKLSALIELGAGFHPDLTGRENIFLNGAILGLKRDEIKRRFDEIVEFSELSRFIDTPVKRYSSGMTVRLGFAVASCIEPDILLVDEVLAVGDTSFQQKCMQRIRSLLKMGTSIIFVSHNLYLIQAACNVALYLHKGVIKHYGTVKDVFNVYEHDVHQERIFALEKQNKDVKDNSRNMEIERVEVMGKDRTKMNLLLSTESAQVKIHYKAYAPLGKIQVRVFIFRSDGVNCCMMRTKLDGFDLFIEAGRGVITLQLSPLQLIGGSYYAEVAFLDETDSLLITSEVGRSDWFTVRGKAISHSESSIFEPNTTWSQESSRLP